LDLKPAPVLNGTGFFLRKTDIAFSLTALSRKLVFRNSLLPVKVGNMEKFNSDPIDVPSMWNALKELVGQP
jgi:hypothetical protein